jgi:hypothetical protein
MGQGERRTMETYPRLEARDTAWRGSARAAVATASPGRTSTLRRRSSRMAQHHGDDGTGAAEAVPAPGQSQESASADDKVHGSPETTNRQRRFSPRSSGGGRIRRNRVVRSVDLCTAVHAMSVVKSGAAGVGRSVAAAMAATPSPRSRLRVRVRSRERE